MAKPGESQARNKRPHEATAGNRQVDERHKALADASRAVEQQQRALNGARAELVASQKKMSACEHGRDLRLCVVCSAVDFKWPRPLPGDAENVKLPRVWQQAEREVERPEDQLLTDVHVVFDRVKQDKRERVGSVDKAVRAVLSRGGDAI